MKDKNILDCIAWILVIVGALNWGLVGAFDINVVSMIFGVASLVSKIIYILVGISAIWMLIRCGKCCKKN